MTLHVKSSDTTCVQNFRSVPLMFFEILPFKLKNKNDDKNCRNELFATSPMLVANSKVDIYSDLSYHPVVSKALKVKV